MVHHSQILVCITNVSCQCDTCLCVKQIIKICLEYIVYDPNYNYDDEHDGNNSMETDDDEDAEYILSLLLQSLRDRLCLLHRVAQTILRSLI